MVDALPPGPVMLDLKGLSLAEEERELLAHPAVGGVILFGRNYQSPEQAAGLVAAIRAARPGPLLIAVDQEGGRVQRLRDGYTRLPPADAYWRHGGGADEAKALAKEAGWLMAAEVRAIDVDFSFAPVLDVDCGISEIIGDRSFARDPHIASRQAGAFIAGMREAGMASVGKHFPGHGGVAADSHLALPLDGRSWDELWEADLLPYRQLIPLGLDAVMPAHVVYSQLDRQPAGFSRFWLQEVLRQRLNFNGAAFSDDLSMEGAAAAGDFAQRAHAALEAGCDMVLVCNNPDAARVVLSTLENFAFSQVSKDRLLRLRGREGASWPELKAMPRWRQAVESIEKIACGDKA